MRQGLPSKLRSFIIIILMLLALPIVAQAQYIFTTNSNGSLNISEYDGSDSALTIPDTTNGLPITSIGDEAFFQIYSLTSVTMGSNITIIGTNAFFQCPNLSSVAIPASITKIGQGPFIDCLSLTDISLGTPNSFYTVTNELLFNKTQTQLIEFPGGAGGSYTIAANVTNVGEAFIGNTLTAISAASANLYFSSSNGVLFNKNKTVLIEYPGSAPGSYTVPHSVTTIQSASFEYSTGVDSVAIDTPVTSIGGYAFYDCSGLSAISVNPTNVNYSSSNGVLFNKTQTQLIQYPSGLPGSYFVSGTVTNIGNGAFGDAFGLTEVVIPNSVTTIGEEAFYSCESLTNATIGNSSVASIGRNAFIDCIGLTSVTFPSTVTNIGQEAFASCESLTNACFEGSPPTDGGSIFFFDEGLATINYLSGAAGWGATYDNIPTTPCATCGAGSPLLSIALAGANVILTWPGDVTGFTLESTMRLGSNPVWTTVSPPPVIVNGYNTVTNAIPGAAMFYRLQGQ